MANVLKEYEKQIKTFNLIPSDGGRFEVTVNDTLVYSKLKTKRHVFPGEVSKLIQTYQENGG